MLTGPDQNRGHQPLLDYPARKVKNENHRNNNQIIKREFEIRLSKKTRVNYNKTSAVMDQYKHELKL